MKIEIKDEDLKKCRDFASKKCKTTFNRFNKNVNEREERLFLGKLGEFVFFKLLVSRGIDFKEESLFEIWDDVRKGDTGDFETKEGKSVDIKTARKHFHTRIMVPYDQFENGKWKEFYVGVKINEELTKGEIWGFCSKEKLMQRPKKDWGEGDAYWEDLNALEDIELLIKQF